MRTALIFREIVTRVKNRLPVLPRSAFRGVTAITILGGMLCGMVILAPPLAAREVCSTPQFGVQNVSIDQRAATATEAQTMGVRAAAETGFAVVLNRLLHDEAQARDFIASHDLDEFTDFVYIAEENSLEGRYIALLDFCFDARRLRAALKKAGLQWAELPSPEILVLPVWQAPEGARAWRQDNEWLNGWRDAVASATGLVSFTLLAPTITNERNLRAEDLAIADPDTLTRAAKIAKANQVLLVIAQLDYQGAKRVLNVSGQLLSNQGKGLTQLGRMVNVPIEDDLSLQLGKARDKIIQEVEAGWHAANLISGMETLDVTLQIPLSSLSQWSERLAVLDDIAVINSYKIRILKVDQALVTISLSGSVAALQNALASHGLNVAIPQDGDNILRLVTLD